MKDLYEKFAYDYDEFGPIEEYLGDEKTFLRDINLIAEKLYLMSSQLRDSIKFISAINRFESITM